MAASSSVGTSQTVEKDGFISHLFEESVISAQTIDYLNKFDFDNAIDGIVTLGEKGASLVKISQLFLKQFKKYMEETELKSLNDRLHIVVKLPEPLYNIRDSLISIFVDRARGMGAWEIAVQGTALIEDEGARRKTLTPLLGKYKIIRNTIYTWTLEDRFQIAFNLAQTFIECDTEARLLRHRYTPMPLKVRNYYIHIFKGYCDFRLKQQLDVDLHKASSFSSNESSMDSASLRMLDLYQLRQVEPISHH